MFRNLNYRSQVNLSLVAGALALALLSLSGWYFLPQPADFSRLADALIFLYVTPLAILIFYVAYKRGHNEHLVNGYLADDADIQLDKACLQNTLEQTVLAIPLVISIQAIAPAIAPKIVLIHLVAFLLGRLSFCLGYRIYPALRFPGFVVTYYANMMLFLLCLLLLVWRYL